MNQKDYLKRYLSSKKEKKTSKKKKKPGIGNLMIIDDSMESGEVVETIDNYGDEPTIAEATYETDSYGSISTLSHRTEPSIKRDLTRVITESKVIQEAETVTKSADVMKRRKLMRTKKITPEEEARKEREAILQTVIDKKHNQWNRGVKQTESLQQKVNEDSYEATKQFTRHANDEDLNARQKAAIREEDPMLDYINSKNVQKLTSVMPSYSGSYPPNRYNIRPGYRWDGVDRSSGYEKSYFEKKNAKKAQEEDMYKWSVEDM